ncbi:MAG TPA: asparagine--tRNA ligase [Kofleriaceae bacterium]|nr:asparagine--tRNA ligase [Kofleriaceae bacterium]
MVGKLLYIEDIARALDEWEGKTVTLRGWLYGKRSSGKLHFLQLRDGTGILQCVMFFKDVPEEMFHLADHLAQETSMVITGEVRRDKRSPIGFELGVKTLEVIAEPTAEYPITPKEHGTAFLMDHRHLWLRSKRQVAILRVRHEIVMAIRDYFDRNGFILIDAPIFTPNACEGTSNLFQVGYFDDKAYLTQSGQLYMEAAAMALGKVYCFGPTFRAEKSKTRRHLTEFWMIEPEVAFLELDGIMDLAEDLLVDVVSRVLDRRKAELVELERDTTHLERVQKPFPRIRYTEAIDILNKAGTPSKFGDDFGGDDETVISQAFDRPVMVNRYPSEIKAFYMKRDPDDDRLALGVDVLAPEGYGEVVGGGQRETSLETLENAIAHHQLPKEAFEWYLDLRRYGAVPHGGFGLGLERTVSWICGLKHVRETIPFPRMLERLTP